MRYCRSFSLIITVIHWLFLQDHIYKCLWYNGNTKEKRALLLNTRKEGLFMTNQDDKNYVFKPPDDIIYFDYNDIVRKVTRDGIAFIHKLEKDGIKITAQIIGSVILKAMQITIKKVNTDIEIGKRSGNPDITCLPHPIPKRLEPYTLAKLIMEFHYIKNVNWGGTDNPANSLLAVYNPSEGIYDTNESCIRNAVRAIAPTIKKNELEETTKLIADLAECVQVNSDPDLIPVANGIYDFKNKILKPFTPDFVSLYKSPIPYDDNAITCPVLYCNDGTPFVFDDWLQDLFDNDQELTTLAWQMIAAALRCYYPWNKCFILYNTVGCNGKGCLVKLIEQLVGEKNVTSIPFSKFGDRFGLSALPHSMVICTNENATSDFTKLANKIKEVITGDSVEIEIKYKNPFTMKFRGLMIQCCNKFPTFGDQTASLYRRFVLIPFDKTFVGNEKPEIKEKLLADPSLLRYILYKVLNSEISDFYSFIKPKRAQQLLEQFKVNNDNVRMFWASIRTQFVSKIIKASDMYEIYKAWRRTDIESGHSVRRTEFDERMAEIIENDPDWEIIDRPNNPLNVSNIQPVYEPVLKKYHVSALTKSDFGYSPNYHYELPTSIKHGYKKI